MCSAAGNEAAKRRRERELPCQKVGATACVRDSGDPRYALARPHARRADAAPGHVHRRGVHHALVAARLSAEHAIGVRHGCFCAHQCLLRLLDLTPVEAYRDAVLHHDRRAMPGAVRASAGLSTSATDIDRLVAAVADIAAGRPAPVAYVQDVHTGDFWPEHGPPGWADEDRAMGASCARG